MVSQANRLLDMGLEDGEPRGPLGGFFPASLPVPTLQQALMHVATKHAHLHPETGRSVKLARSRAKRSQSKHLSLTMDECIAIVLYTIEESPVTYLCILP